MEPTRKTDPVSQRVHALIFNGLSAALTDDQWMPLSERARIADAIYDSLRAGDVEVRLRGEVPLDFDWGIVAASGSGQIGGSCRVCGGRQRQCELRDGVSGARSKQGTTHIQRRGELA